MENVVKAFAEFEKLLAELHGLAVKDVASLLRSLDNLRQAIATEANKVVPEVKNKEDKN